MSLVRLLHASVLAAVLAVPCAASAQTQTPTDAFLAYRKALASAKAYAEILPFMEPKGRAMVEAMPAAQQASMFGFMKKFAGTFTDVAVTKETVTGDSAVLELSGKDPKGQAATGIGADDESGQRLEGRHREVVLEAANAAS